MTQEMQEAVKVLMAVDQKLKRHLTCFRKTVTGTQEHPYLPNLYLASNKSLPNMPQNQTLHLIVWVKKFNGK